MRERNVDVVLRWGGDVVEVRRLSMEQALTIGRRGDADFFIPLDTVDHFQLLARTAAGWELRTAPGMTGTIRRGDQELPVSPIAGALVLLADDVEATLHAGPFTIEVRIGERARLAHLAPIFDVLWANTATVTMFSMAAVVAIATLMPSGSMTDDDDLLTNPARYSTLLITPRPRMPERTAPPDPTQAPAAGASSTKPAARTVADPAAARRAQEMKMRETLAALGGVSGVGSVFGDGGVASGMVEALGGITGERAAGLTPGGVVSLRGAIGDGVGTGLIGSVGISTRGRGNGTADYGAVGGGLIARADRAPVVVEERPPEIVGTLDKELIRRVVREHASQVRYCYERELVASPGLTGKVSVRWVINAEGHVVQADAEGVDDELEGCLEQRVRTWVFPKPKGGGVVVVQYPFVLKPGG